MSGPTIGVICALCVVASGLCFWMWRRSVAQDRRMDDIARLRASDLLVKEEYARDIANIASLDTAADRMRAAVELHRKREAARKAGTCDKSKPT